MARHGFVLTVLAVPDFRDGLVSPREKALQQQGVRPSEAVRHDLHDVGGEVRRLLNERVEASQIDRNQDAVRHRDDSGSSGTWVDQGEFSEKGPGPRFVDDPAAHEDSGQSFQKDVHQLSLIVGLEESMARGKRDPVLVVTEQVGEVHLWNLFRTA
jgi:hypothetical protein